MFGGGEGDELAVPAVVQEEIAGAEAVVVDEAEQAAGVAVAEKVSEIEEVVAGVVADVANEFDEVEAGAVVDAANEVEEIAAGAVADANEVEEVAAGAVAEVVANAYIDIEEEEIDLSQLPLYLEQEHPAKFAFMVNHYGPSPVAADADSAAVAAEHEIAIPAEVVIGGVEAGALPANEEMVMDVEEEEPVAANEEEERKWLLVRSDAQASYYKCRHPYCPATRTVTSHETINGEHLHEDENM